MPVPARHPPRRDRSLAKRLTPRTRGPVVRCWPPPEHGAVLADPITDASASIVQVAPAHLDLLLSATDNATEDASVERVACIGFTDGVATLAYYSAVAKGTAPELTGPPAHHQFRLSAPYVSSVDAMAYPVRTYTQTVGYLGGRVRVISDDRPGIGVTVAVDNAPDSTDTSPVVVAVQPGSPAARAGIRPGDDLINILPAIHRPHSGNEQPAIVDELAAHRVGDHLTVILYREDQQVTVHLTPVMIENTVAAPGTTPPTPAVIGVTINPDAQTLGAAIASVAGLAGSPGRARRRRHHYPNRCHARHRRRHPRGRTPRNRDRTRQHHRHRPQQRHRNAARQPRAGQRRQ